MQITSHDSYIMSAAQLTEIVRCILIADMLTWETGCDLELVVYGHKNSNCEQ